MPAIKVLATVSLSPPVDTTADLAISVEPEKQEALYRLVESFLILNPTPTDEHMHMLAACVGMDPESFEQVVYEFFGDLLKNERAEGEDEVTELLSDAHEMPGNNYSHGNGENYSVAADGVDEEDGLLVDNDEEDTDLEVTARLNSSTPPVQKISKKQNALFDTNDLDDSAVTAATPAETTVLDRAYHSLAAEVRQTGETIPRSDVAAYLCDYAQNDPDCAKVFGTSHAAARNVLLAAEEYLKTAPFSLTTSDSDGRAATDDGIADRELFGTEDPLKEAGDSDGAVDEEVAEETFDA